MKLAELWRNRGQPAIFLDRCDILHRKRLMTVQALKNLAADKRDGIL